MILRPIIKIYQPTAVTILYIMQIVNHKCIYITERKSKGDKTSFNVIETSVKLFLK